MICGISLTTTDSDMTMSGNYVNWQCYLNNTIVKSEPNSVLASYNIKTQQSNPLLPRLSEHTRPKKKSLSPLSLSLLIIRAKLCVENR